MAVSSSKIFFSFLLVTIECDALMFDVSLNDTRQSVKFRNALKDLVLLMLEDEDICNEEDFGLCNIGTVRNS